ncbi:clostripain-related cysteine peptidase [Methanosarcina sp. 2.H.A.1B.4]|uniref:clostripain-related cysteine peptidase n=1 Tax=Methanosarcina sp. 2.H.A.1B.4 TaxID=1483600 RepID=UPI000621D651|nr:clostripain-related cysteine peptidase [Methanosarcina sp. 2.H.A.1B.4]KKG13135.1 hypothetical protein EO92_08215 [Methanosarcina sp. 2.H.A.1B.4]
MGWKFQKAGFTVIIFIIILFLLLSSGCLKEGTDFKKPGGGAEIESRDSAGPEADIQKHQLSTVVALYMVGSDLESSNKYASKDILEIIDGASTLNVEDTEILIAYGGASAEGWEGMTIAELEDLRKDGEDGTIGNGGIHRETYPHANMGDAAGLETFLSYIRENYESESTLLIFWDHGDAYRGVCFDENHGYDRLELPELSDTLKASGMHFDLIGFDACLMSTLELASAVKPSADYMLASESIEPTHGWDYVAFIGYVSENPKAPTEEIGRVIIDSYLENSSHVPPRTLSLLDLSKTDEVLQNIDRLADDMGTSVSSPEGYCGLGASLTKTRKFGVEPKKGSEISMDLKSFALRIGEEMPELAGRSEALIKSLEDFVIYSRQDGTMPDAYGVSVYSPQTQDNYSKYYSRVSISEAWSEFLDGYSVRTCADFTEPGISKSGDSFSVKDDSGLASVDQVYFIASPEGPVLIGRMPLNCSGGTNYSLPAWGGEWIFIEDSKTGKSSLIYAACGGESENGNRILTAELGLQRDGEFRSCLAQLYLDTLNGTVIAYMNPYEALDDGNILFSKEVLVPEPGDIITTYAPVYGESDIKDWTTLGRLKMDENTTFVYDFLPAGTYYTALYAEDYRLNFNMSEPVEIIRE